MPPPPPTAACHFPATQWSVLQLAAASGVKRRDRGHEHFCQTYWSPLYAYARARGQSPADSQDLTQSFLLHFLQSGKLERADAGRGRFRSLLRTAFRNHMIATWRHASADKRGGVQAHIALDATPGSPYPVTPEVPDMAFDRAWAQSSIDAALQTMAQAQRKRGLAREFAALRPFLTGDGDSTLKTAAGEIGKSHDAVRRQLCRLRNEFRHLLREQVAATLDPDEDLEAEMRYLVDCLRTEPSQAVATLS